MGRRDTIDVGASSAHRWSICTKSPSFIVQNAAQLPEDSSVFADEGTQAHEVAACLLEGKGIPPGTPAEMVQHVNVYVDHVRTHQTAGSRLAVEKRVPLFYVEGRSGIVDAATYRPDGLWIDDLKYGQGVSVEAHGNKQIAIYAESYIAQMEMIMDIPADFPVHLSIVQPRDRNNPQAVRTWSLTRGELREIADELLKKALIALTGEGAQFVPHDDACRFCPAKGICSAYANVGLTALPEETRMIEVPAADVPHPSTLTREQRIKVLKVKKALIDWLDAVEEQERADLLRGEPPMGFKMVEGRSNRTWSDPAAAQTLLSNHLGLDEMRPRADLISPAQAEKALKGVDLSKRFKTRMAQLITRPGGKPTLAPEDDSRPALNDSNLDNLQKLENHE